MRELKKRFGSFWALGGVNFSLDRGEVLGLVGPNGSGKTTCINVITGLFRPDEGAIEFRGQSIGGKRMNQLAHLGINRSFQIPKPFSSLTVSQNVDVALKSRGGATDEERDELIHFVDLYEQAERNASELTSAQQKMLDLARALAMRPSVLCVDEIGAGLNPSELMRVAEKLRALAESGMALLVVEHLMDFVDKVTDRVLVLSAGKNIFSGKLAEAVRDEEVVAVFLGG